MAADGTTRMRGSGLGRGLLRRFFLTVIPLSSWHRCAREMEKGEPFGSPAFVIGFEID
jgi:hypothetical protein